MTAELWLVVAVMLAGLCLAGSAIGAKRERKRRRRRRR